MISDCKLPTIVDKKGGITMFKEVCNVRKLSQLVTLFAVMVSVMSLCVIPASAESIDTRSIYNGYIYAYPLETNFQDPIPERPKENNSQVYVCLEDIGYQSVGVYVQAVGIDSNGGYHNCTQSNGALVQELVIFEGPEYGIDNTIHSSYDDASLRLRCSYVVVNDIINVGKWSADSSKEYPTP